MLVRAVSMNSSVNGVQIDSTDCEQVQLECANCNRNAACKHSVASGRNGSIHRRSLAHGLVACGWRRLRPAVPFAVRAIVKMSY